MKSLFRIFLSSIALCVLAQVSKSEEAIDYERLAPSFESIVVQHQGRLKPFDTFARVNLRTFSELEKVEGMTATEWLLELLLDPSAAYQRKVFKTFIDEIPQALDVPIDEDHHYSFSEMSIGLNGLLPSLREYSAKEPEDRSIVEKQLLEMYQKTMLYLDISRSFTGLIHDIPLSSESLASELGYVEGDKASYLDILDKRDLVGDKLEAFQAMSNDERSGSEALALMQLIESLQVKMMDQSSSSFHIVPTENDQTTAEWSSPWTLLSGRPLTDWESSRIQKLQALVEAARHGEYEKVDAFADEYKASVTVGVRNELELHYNKGRFLVYSNTFYILAFLLLLVSFTGLFRETMYRLSYGAVAIGFALHAYAIILRCIILARPPVSTLYESVIFVNLILVAIALLIEWRKRNALGLLIACVSGVLLHFIGFRYERDGDSFGTLVAVLNSRFWLSTHVLTITIGYACSFFAGLAAHAYLAFRVFAPKNREKQMEIFKVGLGACFVALFFTTLGTILGGIWGDQSWGRFWGWDPKENGALLIVIWLLICVHGRLAGYFREVGFMVALSITNITVALAWFGVNLLSVGLHNYGFDDGVARNLYIFCGIEMVLPIVALLIIRRRGPSIERSNSGYAR